MTTQVAALRAAVATLARLQAQFAADDRADGWRHRLIQRRGVLQGELAAIANAWQEIERDAVKTEAGQRFRRALLQLRAHIVAHQTAWPAVAIDDGDPLFVASRRAMWAANAEFHAAAAALPDCFDDLADKEST